MSKVIRNVATDAITEASRVHVEPYHLVKLELAGGNLYFSDRKLTSYSGNDYIDSGVIVGQFSWTPEGGQVGSINIVNDAANAAIALILLNGVADATVTIWDTYNTGTGPTDYTTPTLSVKGVCDSSVIKPESIKITVLVGNSITSFIPNRYFTKSEGFNYIPVVGSVMEVAKEIFIFERAYD